VNPEGVAPTVPGVFRDRAPHVERAVAIVGRGALRIEPSERGEYPPGFVLRSADEAVIWNGHLVPPIEGATLGQRRIAGYQRQFLRLLEPVQGEPGTWLIFGDGDAAFRPDDWRRLEALLREEQVPRRAGTSTGGPPEPAGGLLVAGLLLMLAIVMGAVGALGALLDGQVHGSTVAAALAVIGLAIGGLAIVRIWWMERLLVTVSRRQRQRRAIGGRAQPEPTASPSWGTVCVFVIAGLVVGTALLPLANEAYRTIAFPAGGALVGLAVGVVWVGAIRLLPLDPRSRRARR
jgi:hypothetical protein